MATKILAPGEDHIALYRSVMEAGASIAGTVTG